MPDKSIIDLPLSRVWFVSVDDQDYTHAAIPAAVRASLGFHNRLPVDANVVRVGIGWPERMLSHEDFVTWLAGVKTTLSIGMEPAEYSRRGPRFGRTHAGEPRLVGTRFVGKMTQSVIHTEDFGHQARSESIEHMVWTGGAASACMGDSAIDTVSSLGIPSTVAVNATADTKEGVNPGFYHRMNGAGVKLTLTSNIRVAGGRVQIRHIL